MDEEAILPHRFKPLSEGSLLAAIDIGSNSFHLIIARLEHGELKPIETLAEKVQLGAGLRRGRLSDDAIERGLDCLIRFSQLLAITELARIRVVGTNALRQAKNRRAFIEPAERILNVPVDVVYGREEARLVYLGVAHTLADDETSRLVIDIGGGSTEFIIGQRFEPLRLESLQIGCVTYAQDHFPKGAMSKKNYQAAYDRTLVEVSHIKKQFRAKHWAEAVGSSGTLQAIETLICTAGWRTQGIDRNSLEKLRKRLLKFDAACDIEMEGLNENRRQVITAGVAITQAIFDGLEIDTLRVSPGALREGVLYDLIGRLTHEDVRERTVTALLARYGVDEANAQIVGDRVCWLAEKVADEWTLDESDTELLHWAGRCHEIGLAISQKNFNRHSAYLLENSDLPGFAQREQELMSILVYGQQGKIKSALFNAVPKNQLPKVKRMVALLRIAAVLKYVEIHEDLPDFSVQTDAERLVFSLPKGWRELHPLTTWELQQSTSALAKLGVKLEFN